MCGFLDSTESSAGYRTFLGKDEAGGADRAKGHAD